MYEEAKLKKQLSFHQFHSWIEKHIQKTIHGMRTGEDGKSVTTIGGGRKNSAPKSLKSHKSILIEATDEFWHKGMKPTGPLHNNIVTQQSDYMDMEVQS